MNWFPEPSGTTWALIAVMVALLSLLVGQAVALALRRNRSTFPWTAVPLLLGQCVSIVLMAALLTCSHRIPAALAFALGGGFLYLNLTLCFHMAAARRAMERQYAQNLVQQQLELEYYEHEKREREETRALWHDIKKYIQTMETLLADPHSSDAQVHACLSQAKEALSNIHQTVDVGNVVVGSILQRAMAELTATGAVLNFDVWIPETLPIAPVDLSIILGNTLDNAVEACGAMSCGDEVPVVDLILKQRHHTLLYEIMNPIPVSASESGKRVHGYGLRNVAQCVEKYGGTMDMSNTQKTFHVSIQIPLEGTRKRFQ